VCSVGCRRQPESIGRPSLSEWGPSSSRRPAPPLRAPRGLTAISLRHSDATDMGGRALRTGRMHPPLGHRSRARRGRARAGATLRAGNPITGSRAVARPAHGRITSWRIVCTKNSGTAGARSRWRRRASPDGARAREGLARPSEASGEEAAGGGPKGGANPFRVPIKMRAGEGT
jgi:hypothetical protein